MSRSALARCAPCGLVSPILAEHDNSVTLLDLMRATRDEMSEYAFIQKTSS